MGDLLCVFIAPNFKGVKKRAISPEKRSDLATANKNKPSKEKYRVAKKAHNQPDGKPRFPGRTLSAFTDDEKCKNPLKIPVEYYHYIHLFGEDLYDQDDDYLDQTFIPADQLRSIEQQAILGGFDFIHL